MAMRDADSTIQTFLEAIQPLLPAYRHPTISFVAPVHEGHSGASLLLETESI